MESTAVDKAQELAEKVKNVAVKEKNTAPKGEKKAKKAKGSEVPANGPLELSPEPDYITHRVQLFDRLKAEYEAEVAGVFRYHSQYSQF